MAHHQSIRLLPERRQFAVSKRTATDTDWVTTTGVARRWLFLIRGCEAMPDFSVPLCCFV
jgi:hypothetical protein